VRYPNTVERRPRHLRSLPTIFGCSSHEDVVVRRRWLHYNYSANGAKIETPSSRRHEIEMTAEKDGAWSSGQQGQTMSAGVGKISERSRHSLLPQQQ